MKVNKEKTLEALLQFTENPAILRVGKSDGKVYVECVKPSFWNTIASFLGIRSYNQKKILQVIQACANSITAMEVSARLQDKIKEPKNSKRTIQKLDALANSLFPFRREVENAQIDSFLRGSLPGFTKILENWKKAFDPLDIEGCKNPQDLLRTLIDHAEKNPAIQDIGKTIQQTVKIREGEKAPKSNAVPVKDASAFTTQAFILREVGPRLTHNIDLLKEVNSLANHYNTRGTTPAASWTPEMEQLFDRLSLALTGAKPKKPIVY